jgi:hypothetical protein
LEKGVTAAGRSVRFDEPDAFAERVAFHNPLQNREFIQTIYLARTEAAPKLYAPRKIMQSTEQIQSR